MKSKLPKVIYVVFENDKDGGYLVASKNIDDWGSGTIVGIYEQKAVKTIKVKTELI